MTFAALACGRGAEAGAPGTVGIEPGQPSGIRAASSDAVVQFLSPVLRTAIEVETGDVEHVGAPSSMVKHLAGAISLTRAQVTA